MIILMLGWAMNKSIALASPAWQPMLAAAPPVLISLLLAILFGRSLFYGEALVTRIARCEQSGGLPHDLLPYTRRLTAIWALFMAGCALLSAILAQKLSPLQLATLPPVLAACLMCSEYLYRKWRFRQYVHRNPLAVMLFLILHGFPQR